MEVKITCDDCNNEADHAFCEKHLDSKLQDAFDAGKKEGYDEGYEKGTSEVAPTE